MDKFKKRGGKAYDDKRPWDKGSSNRGSDQKMFKADCATCGRVCEVPFKPNGRKPVYCSACFSKDNNSGDSRGFRDRNNRGSRSEEKRAFKTKCDACGNICEVPFRPTGSKPVYCRGCFDNKGASAHKTRQEVRVPDPHVEQFKALNAKLDTIIKLLSPSLEVEKVEKPEKATKAKKAPKAPVKKKAVAKKKKAPVKKKAVAKKKK